MSKLSKKRIAREFDRLARPDPAAVPTPSSSSGGYDESSPDSSLILSQQSEIDFLRAQVVELEKRLAERAQLVRKSEALRAELTRENHELRKVNDRLRYLSTPSPFEASFGIRVKGTPPSTKNLRKRKAKQDIDTLTRSSTRIAKRVVVESVDTPSHPQGFATQLLLDVPRDKPETSDEEYATPFSSSSRDDISRVSASASPVPAIPRRLIKADRSTSQLSLSEFNSHPQDVEMIDEALISGEKDSSKGSKGYDSFWASYRQSRTSTPSNTPPSISIRTRSSKTTRAVAPALQLPAIPLEFPDFYRRVNSTAVQSAYQPRQAYVANEPWYDDPTRDLIPRSTINPHGQHKDVESSRRIDAILQMDVSEPALLKECDAALLSLMELLIFEGRGVQITLSSWDELGTILNRWRSRCVAWPSEVDFYTLKPRRAKGPPRALSATDVDLLRRVLLRRFPPHNTGLHVRMWNDDEESGDFPVIFVTTTGGYYSLQGNMPAKPELLV